MKWCRLFEGRGGFSFLVWPLLWQCYQGIGMTQILAFEQKSQNKNRVCRWPLAMVDGMKYFRCVLIAKLILSDVLAAHCTSLLLLSSGINHYSQVLGYIHFLLYSVSDFKGQILIHAGNLNTQTLLRGGFLGSTGWDKETPMQVTQEQ